MTGQVESPVNDPISPLLVSGAFVQQYYQILHEQPEQVHKFYHDSSILGRLDPNGTMGSVTTLAAINETIISMDFSNYLIQIDTADAQLSHEGGVLIVVTGSLTPSDGVCRKFTQSFFLAPQESGGYFVLNDVLRFISERQLVEVNHVVTQENESSHIAITGSETCSALAEPIAAEKSLNSDHVTVENNVTERQVIHPSVNGTAVEYNVTTRPTVHVAKEDPKRTPVAVPLPPAPTCRDVAKRSYASIVKDMKEGPPAVQLASTPKQKPPKPVTKDVEVPVKSSAKPDRDNETSASDGIVAENNTSRNEHGYSVFVRNLPFYSNIEFVEGEFKKFGAVKPGGVQVVHYKFDGICFGFVEYESQQSMEAAIEASPVRIGEKQVVVEKKMSSRQATRSGAYPQGDSGEGRCFQAGGGVYCSDNFGGQEGGYANRANYRGSDNFNHKNEGHENYNRRNDSGDNYSCRNESCKNYNRTNESGENYNCMGDAGENYNCRVDSSENYNRRNDGSKNYNRRGHVGENYNHRNNGENYNRRGNGGENNRRSNMGKNYSCMNDGSKNYRRELDGSENYNHRNDRENYNRRGNGGGNNRRGNMAKNYSRKNVGSEDYRRGGDGGENYNHRNDGGENYYRRNDGGKNQNSRNDSGESGQNYNSRNDGGKNFNRGTDGVNFNRRNFRSQNEFSGGRGQGPPPGPSLPVQTGNRRSARVNGPKQPPGAA